MLGMGISVLYPYFPTPLPYVLACVTTLKQEFDLFVIIFILSFMLM